MRRWHFWNVAASTAALLEISFTDQVHSLLRHDSIYIASSFCTLKIIRHSLIHLDFVLEFFQGNFCHTKFFFDLLNDFISVNLIGTKPFSSHTFQHHFITFWGFQHAFQRKIMWEFSDISTNFFEKNSKRRTKHSIKKSVEKWIWIEWTF